MGRFRGFDAACLRRDGRTRPSSPRAIAAARPSAPGGRRANRNRCPRRLAKSGQRGHYRLLARRWLRRAVTPDLPLDLTALWTLDILGVIVCWVDAIARSPQRADPLCFSPAAERGSFGAKAWCPARPRGKGCDLLSACAVDEVIEHWPDRCDCSHALSEDERRPRVSRRATSPKGCV